MITALMQGEKKMDDLISRQEAIDAIEPILKSILQGNSFKAINVIDKIRGLPSAQPEQKKGEWEEIEVIPEAYDIAGVKTWASKMRCNQCGFTTFAIEGHFAQYYFCPNCGSYNGGEQE